jgi:hypothetical protein
MEYGLRQYEARQRLLWFLFFLACLLIALPAKGIYLSSVPRAPLKQISLEMVKFVEFWHQQQWVHVGPVGTLLSYLVWVLVIFSAGRLACLLLHFVGKAALARTLPKVVPNPSQQRRIVKPSALLNSSQLKLPESLVRWTQEMRGTLLRFVFHAYQRALFTFASPNGVLIADEMADRQHRLADIDWQILNGSWTPFRWILRLLPLLALFQTLWLIYLQVQPVLSGQKELQDFLGALLPSVLPFVQVVLVTLIFGLGYGLLIRLEHLYLAGLDALFYDRLLSSMPIRSSDTILILDALQKHFLDMNATLERLERSLSGR